MILRITTSGTVFQGDAADIERLRQEFEQRHCLRFPHILEPNLMERLHRQIEEAEFAERIHERIGSNKELCMADNVIRGVLNVLLNSEELFGLVEPITECGPIGCFTGRVYRMMPGCGHHDAWHGDVGESRLVALSINLSKEVYAGGVLQIRDRESGEILNEVANTGFGDAIVFKLCPRLEHRVTDVKGTIPKTAFAGWFQSQPDFRSMLKTCQERSQTA